MTMKKEEGFMPLARLAMAGVIALFGADGVKAQATEWFYDASGGTAYIYDDTGWEFKVEEMDNPLELEVTKCTDTGDGLLDFSVPIEGGRSIIGFNGNVGTKAFRRDLEALVMPSSLQWIDDDTFSDCGNLERVDFNGCPLAYIGEYAFDSCASLTELAIPASVDFIGYRAFGYCDNLERVEYRSAFPPADADESMYDYSDDVVSYISPGYVRNWVESGEISDYLVLGMHGYDLSNAMWKGRPIREGDFGSLAYAWYWDDVTYAPLAAITNVFGWHFIVTADGSALTVGACTNAPSSLDVLDFTGIIEGGRTIVSYSDAPGSAGGLLSTHLAQATGLVLATTATNIGANAFYACTAIGGTLAIPTSVKRIGDCAFYDTALAQVVVQGSLATLGNQVFANPVSKAALTSVTFMAGYPSVSVGNDLYLNASAVVTYVYAAYASSWIGKPTFSGTFNATSQWQGRPIFCHGHSDKWSDVLNRNVDWPSGDAKYVSGNNFYIFEPRDLAQFAHTVNSGNSYAGKTVWLTGNLDMGAYVWTPAGANGTAFAGTFNGQGNTIGGLRIGGDSPVWSWGLFANLDGATVTSLDIAVKSFSLTNLYYSVSMGALAGYATGTAVDGVTVSGKRAYCYFTKPNAYTDVYVGGLVGYTDGSTFTDCANVMPVSVSVDEGNISGGVYVGGIAGYAYDCAILGCRNAANVTFGGKIALEDEEEGEEDEEDINYNIWGYIGGIVGYGDELTLEGCLNEGDVKCVNVFGDGVGGIAGYVWDAIFDDCHNRGDVQGYSGKQVGGVAGSVDCCEIINCSNTGDISADIWEQFSAGRRGRNPGCAGGIVGRVFAEAAVMNCWSSGDVLGGADRAGGIVGGMRLANFNIANCYSSSTNIVDRNGDNFALVGASSGTLEAYSCFWHEDFGEFNGIDNYSHAEDLGMFGDPDSGGGTVTYIGTTSMRVPGDLLDALNDWVLNSNSGGGSFREWTLEDSHTGYPVFGPMAKKRYIVEFDLGGYTATNAAQYTQKVKVAYNAPMPEITVPLFASAGATNYTFVTYTNAAGTAFYTGAGTSAHVWDQASDDVLYVVVAQNNPNEVEVYYYADNGTPSLQKQTIDKSLPTPYYLAGITTPVHNDPDYDFAEWNTDPDGEGATITASTLFIPGETSIYAIWKFIGGGPGGDDFQWLNVKAIGVDGDTGTVTLTWDTLQITNAVLKASGLDDWTYTVVATDCLTNNLSAWIEYQEPIMKLGNPNFIRRGVNSTTDDAAELLKTDFTGAGLDPKAMFFRVKALKP